MENLKYNIQDLLKLLTPDMEKYFLRKLPGETTETIKLKVAEFLKFCLRASLEIRFSMHVILSAAKNLLTNQGKTRFFAALRMTIEQFLEVPLRVVFEISFLLFKYGKILNIPSI